MDQIIIAIPCAGTGKTTVIAIPATSCTACYWLVAINELVIICAN